MPTFCFFEIPANDIEKIRKFYSELFNWRIEKDENQTEYEYWMIDTAALGCRDGIKGAIEKRQDPQQKIVIWISVPSVEEYSNKIEKLGGKVFVSKTAVVGMGYYAYCLDPENNYFAIWEPNENAE
jgi:hypothetical protein